jgi:hypothetical protein
MDRITENIIKEFATANGLTMLNQSALFEHFTGFLVTSKHYTETFSTDDIQTGSGGDIGIDSISIIVNGSLVTAPEEINDLIDTNGYLDVTIIFNQAETSSSFSSAKIGQIEFGVLDFLKTVPQLPMNDEIKLKHSVFSEVLVHSSKFKRGNPTCHVYYCTTGQWIDDPHLKARKEAAQNSIFSTGLFRKVEFECIGAEGLQKLYRAAKNAISTEILFSQRLPLPVLPEIDQAYVGVLPVQEYLKLIENSDDDIITSIFYDNVRHWQEWNAVNTEMKQTLENRTKQIYLPLLNNGVTVIAKNIIPSAQKFTVEDYQVVNRCQTSYVLHECRDVIDESVLIPIRIIATTNEEIKNSIIKATNRQTQIAEDQLLALSDFPKQLEAYFPTFPAPSRLYYERRSRQYVAQEDVEKIRVISMAVLVRAFAAMFMNAPHRTTRNYKSLLKNVGDTIFNKDHRLEMYYTSALAHFKIEQLFRRGFLEARYKPARYHILYAFRVLAAGMNLPRPNSAEMKRYCESILNTLNDDGPMQKLFERARLIVDNAAINGLDRDDIRTEPFTERVKAQLTGLGSSFHLKTTKGTAR